MRALPLPAMEKPIVSYEVPPRNPDVHPQRAVADAVLRDVPTVGYRRRRILDEAAEIVTKDRNNQYGDPETEFQTIADLWSAYLERIYPELDLPRLLVAHDVAAMMALLKVARIAANPQHRDSWVDLAGYAACGAEAAGH